MLSRPYLLTLILALFLTFFHIYANTNFLYFSYKWLDIPMHLLGGFTSALFFVSLLVILGKKLPTKTFLFLVLLATLIAGSLWEVYEFLKSTLYGIEYVANRDMLDTFSDIFNDIIGALFALWLSIKKKWYA